MSIRTMCDLPKFLKRTPNPRYEDLPEEIQSQVPQGHLTNIECHEVEVFGRPSIRFHVTIVGSRQAMVFNKNGELLRSR